MKIAKEQREEKVTHIPCRWEVRAKETGDYMCTVLKQEVRLG